MFYNKCMKERLINRAVDLWQKYGYENVSVNMISKTCGVTKGSFYHHFSSKEEVIDSYIDIRVKNVLKEIDQNASYADILFSIIQKMTEPIMELNEDLIFIVFIKFFRTVVIIDIIIIIPVVIIFFIIIMKDRPVRVFTDR